jgi:hypothetical protein
MFVFWLRVLYLADFTVAYRAAPLLAYGQLRSR